MAAPGSRPVVGLVRACHPGPTLAVTTVTTLLASGVGRSGAELVAVAAAVATGQLSVGWSNDAHDVPVDRRAQRTDKPILAGEVARGTVWLAAGVALATTSMLSIVAAGLIGGAVHLVAVALAWSYNLGVSRTRWSFAPYVGAFALLPAFVTYGATPSSPPARWAVVGFGSMGLGAHLINAVRDLAADRRAGVDGSVVRLGPGRSRTLAAAAFVVAGGAISVGASGAWPLAAVGIPAVVLAALVPTVWLAPSRWAFRAVLVAGVLLVVWLAVATFVGDVDLAALERGRTAGTHDLPGVLLAS